MLISYHRFCGRGPNLEGLSPGQITELYSFDHDLGSFVAIGTGHVSLDGTVIQSDHGVGIIKGGWHCGGNPFTFGTVAKCKKCEKCFLNTCIYDPTVDFSSIEFNPIEIIPFETNQFLPQLKDRTTITVKLDRQCPDTAVKFTDEPVANSGGHFHDANRPKGKFFSSTFATLEQEICITDIQGECKIDYRAPQFGGRETIIATLPSAVDKKKDIDIRVPNLQPMAPGNEYTLIGATATHPDNHFGLSEVNSALQQIASDYHSTFPQAGIIQINDMTLERGGLFDISATWKSPHIYHRVGRTADIRSHTIPQANRSEFERICTINGVDPFLEAPGTPNEHYHLDF